ncbi:T9SS type A sorting domain-containing protein [Tenacibaculum sp.]|uniref:T9SS type A sorting domain-containing protein n=1 Tax=Tenacibaculum sp. TaxID=1906242 RepID=UPI003D0C060F
MRKFYTLILLVFSIYGYSQDLVLKEQSYHTVSTILNSPTIDIDDALAIDSEGNLYGSNFGNYSGTSVYKITPNNEVSVFITGLKSPNGLAFDSNDNLFVVEFLGGAIHKYDKNGNLLKSYNVGGYPSGLVKDFYSDAMIFTNSLDSSVNKLLQDGSVITLHQGAPLLYPVGLTFDRDGKLFIGNYVGRQIYSLSTEGNLEYVATVPDSGTDFPYLAFITYANGRLFATIYGEHKIYKVHPNKIDSVEVYSGSVYGGSDGYVSDATYAYPAGIIASKSGKEMYVSEYGGGNVRKITRGGMNDEVNEKISMSLSPNPVAERLKIKAEIPNKGNVNIKVVNLYGKMVFESKDFIENKSFTKEINLKGLPVGVYNVLLFDDQNKISKKIIVRK